MHFGTKSFHVSRSPTSACNLISPPQISNIKSNAREHLANRAAQKPANHATQRAYRQVCPSPDLLDPCPLVPHPKHASRQTRKTDADQPTAILTPRTLLVPYSPHHVPTYHEWMQDAELRKATASEPLTLNEEYAMQASWRGDADKLTFIACTAPVPPAPSAAEPGAELVVQGTKHDAPPAMIGDVNLFLVEDDEEEEDADADGEAHGARQRAARDVGEAAATAVPVIGEVEIMVASKAHQGQGFGYAVLQAFLTYVRRNLDAVLGEFVSSLGDQSKDGARLSYLRVKIGAENARSVRLFEKLGFVKASESPNYFGELELRLDVDDVWGDSKDAIEVRYELP